MGVRCRVIDRIVSSALDSMQMWSDPDTSVKNVQAKWVSGSLEFYRTPAPLCQRQPAKYFLAVSLFHETYALFVCSRLDQRFRGSIFGAFDWNSSDSRYANIDSTNEGIRPITNGELNSICVTSILIDGTVTLHELAID